MERHTRYEGAIIRDHELLLIRHQHHESGRTYWLFPGGGKEPEETEHECVIREMKEETSLDVLIERVLLDEPVEPDPDYVCRKIYLCRPVSGEARPGYEPEADAAAEYMIAEVRWFNLQNQADWDELLLSNAVTYPLALRVSELLGYGTQS